MDLIFLCKTGTKVYIASWVWQRTRVVSSLAVLLCFIDQRVRKIRNEASTCPGIFSRTLRFYYVTSSPGSPLPHLFDGHRKLVGRSAIPARSCPRPVMYESRVFMKVVKN